MSKLIKMKNIGSLLKRRFINCHKHQQRYYWRNPVRSGEHEPFYPIVGKTPKVVSPREAVNIIGSKSRVFVHGAASTPTVLLQALCDHAKENNLRNIELVHIHTDGLAPQVSDKYKEHFRDNSLFIGGNVRKAVNQGIADFTPIFLSEIPQLFEDPSFQLDFAMIHVSPPDKHGYCSLGTSVDCARSAVLGADRVIGLINKHVPRTHGDGHVHISHFDTITHHDCKLPEISAGGAGGVSDLDDATKKIGRIIAENLIPNRGCLQMGIGGIPDAVLSCLTNHSDLGIHTEMFSDGILDLIEMGIISNAYKFHHKGKVVTSFCMGTQRLYDFVHDNPLIVVSDCSYVNDTEVIRANNDVMAINSCIEIDITGQVCADSIGTRMYSGIGGQMDFMRGAVLSKGGKAIMALSSTTKKGESKILPILKPGAGVVTTRAHVQYIVTEYGFAKLYGKSLRERARLLIGLAHPDHRESLEKAAFERFGKLDVD